MRIDEINGHISQGKKFAMQIVTYLKDDAHPAKVKGFFTDLLKNLKKEYIDRYSVDNIEVDEKNKKVIIFISSKDDRPSGKSLKSFSRPESPAEKLFTYIQRRVAMVVETSFRSEEERQELLSRIDISYHDYETDKEGNTTIQV